MSSKEIIVFCESTYSNVPNRSADPNKRSGGKILEKKRNVQDRFLLKNQYTCRGEFIFKILIKV